jgi:prevent-host-death family protein
VKFITATELKNKTADTIDAARTEPVTVQKNGKSVVVLIAQAEYERIMALENEYWLQRARAAEKKGFLGVEAASQFLSSELKRHAKA